MLHDGVYGLGFKSPGPQGHDPALGQGDGLAILRGGRIVGSDRHGGVFTGSYRYDASRGETRVTVRLAIPPHGVLLTGFAAGPEGAMVDVAGSFKQPAPVSSAVIDIAGAPIVVELRFVGSLEG